MIEPPSEEPVTRPLEELTVATVGTLLDHVPPPVASDKRLVLPRQIVNVPEIAGTAGYTVSVVVVIQPVGSV
jgi:hypothetical protein